MSAAQHEFDELMRDKERRTGHPEDTNGDDQNLTDDDISPPAASPTENAPRASMSLPRSRIPTTRYGANTGPKGVISDAQNFRDSRRVHRNSMRSGANAGLQQVHGGAEVNQPHMEKTVQSEDDDEDDDEEDEDFMRTWRSSRIQELQNQSGDREGRIQSRERSKRRFGNLTRVDDDGYLLAVEHSAPDITVAVFIYDDYSEVSSLVEDCIRTLAQQYNYIRFIKLHYQDAEMEPAGVPALLAYRGGEKFAGLVPIIEEIPDDAELSASTLEVVLQRHQVLPSRSIGFDAVESRFER